MSYNKFQSKLFGNDISQSSNRLKTYTPKNNPDYMFSSKKHSNNRVNTIEDIQSLNDMDEVNRSVNDRLEFLLKLDSPIPSLPHTLRGDSSRLLHSKGSEVHTSEFFLQQSKRGGPTPKSKLKEMDQLYQTNQMLENKVEELKGIIFQLTGNRQSLLKDSKLKSGFESKRVSEVGSKIEYSVSGGDAKYQQMYREEKAKTLQLQKQKHGLQVLLKLVRQQLQDLKQGGLYSCSSDVSEIHRFNRQLQEQINQLQAQNAQLSDSLIMAEGQLKLYLNKNKQLQLQLQNVVKECKKYQKHNSLMLHSSQIIETNFDQARKRSKIHESLRQTAETEREMMARKDEQIQQLTSRLEKVELGIRSNVGTKRVSEDYEGKIKEFSNKLLSFQSENMKSMMEKEDSFNRQLSSITISHESQIQLMEAKFSEDTARYLKQMDKFKQSAVEAEAKAKERESHLIIIQKKLDGLEKEHKQSLSLFSNNQEMSRQLEKKLQESESKRLEVERDLAHRSKSLNECKEDNDRLWKECQMLNKSITSLKINIEELEGQKIEFEKERAVAQGEKSNMIKEIIHLKQEVSLWKITELEARNKLSEINRKMQEVESRHIKANNKLSVISDKLKSLTEKYGFIPEPSAPSFSSRVEPDHRLELLQWLEQYIDEIRQNQERSFYEREEEQKQYIAQINGKFNEMTMENAKLKDILAQHNINANQRYEEEIIQRLKDSLNSTNKSDPNNLEVIKEESMIRDLEIERLELIRKRLMELQRVEDLKDLTEPLKTEKEHMGEREEWGIDRLMEDIEKALQRIKKNLITKQVHYCTIIKNSQLEVKELKSENQAMRDLKSKMESMSLRFSQQDLRIKEIQSAKRNSVDACLEGEKGQSGFKRRQSWNFKQQQVTTFENLQNNSRIKLTFKKQVQDFLKENLDQSDERLCKIVSELMMDLQQYPDHKQLFELFQKFLSEIKIHEGEIASSAVSLKEILGDYLKSVEEIQGEDMESVQVEREVGSESKMDSE